MIISLKIAELLKGRTIVDVITSDSLKDGADTFESISTDDIFILLDNGTAIRCWNSEWGGLTVGRVKKYYNEFANVEMIEFVEKAIEHDNI